PSLLFLFYSSATYGGCLLMLWFILIEPTKVKEIILIERRIYERTSTSVRVEMSPPGFGTIVGFTKDISDGGALVQIENQSCPPVGTEVYVRFKKAVGPINLEPVKMRVVHQLRNTI